MISNDVPSHATVLIVGGGPAGSYAAAVLRREGVEVVILESARHPRYHVGESLLPSMRHYLRYIELDKEFDKMGFTEKPGAAFRLVQGMDPAWNDFRGLPAGSLTYNVIRSEMDELLLRYAEKLGAKVYEETTVTAIKFQGAPESSRPIAASWTNKQGKTGQITFDWLIDASGRSGLMSTKYLSNRVMRDSLRNVAVWGYWKDCKGFGIDDSLKQGSGYFEVLSDCQGWVWTIPLHDGTHSIGIVMHENDANSKKTMPNAEGRTPSLTEHYLEQLKLAPGVKEAIIGENGHMIPGSVKSASDSSYWATRYSGDHFRIIGDAGNFVDPFFSSGVHIALTGALAAATTICASMKGQVDEPTAQEWHDYKVGVAHTRFLFVVLGAYYQMHAPAKLVLKDFDGKKFDAAFKMFQPIITGVSDRSTELTDARVSEMMNVLLNYFDPHVDDSNIKSVGKRYGRELLSFSSPPMGAEKISKVVPGDEMAQRVLKKMDAHRIFTDDLDPKYMDHQSVLGYAACTTKGKLGLVKADEAQLAMKPHLFTASSLSILALAVLLTLAAVFILSK